MRVGGRHAEPYPLRSTVNGSTALKYSLLYTVAVDGPSFRMAALVADILAAATASRMPAMSAKTIVPLANAYGEYLTRLFEERRKVGTASARC